MAQHYSINHRDDEFYSVFLFVKRVFAKGINHLGSEFERLGQEYAFVDENAYVYKYKKWQDGTLHVFEIHYDPIRKEILDVFWIC